MSFAAPSLAVESLVSSDGGRVEKLLLEHDFGSELNVKGLTANNLNRIALALDKLEADSQGDLKKKSTSGLSSDFATLIRTYSNFDAFLSGSLEDTALPIAAPKIQLSKLEFHFYKSLARTIIYPEASYYLSLVKELNQAFNTRNTSGTLISIEEQQRAQAQCFTQKKLTLRCLQKKSLEVKLSEFLSEIEKNKNGKLEHSEIIEALLGVIFKSSHSKSIVAKRLFYYDGADHVLGNRTESELFSICINSDKEFRYWQMASMTHCREVWKRELGQKEMDPEIEAIFYRQNSAEVKKLVKGLSREVLAGCSKEANSCLPATLEQKLSDWSFGQSFTQEELVEFSINLAENIIL